MKVIVFGSFNIDKVYTMPRLPETGEDIYCSKYELHVGGKGLNQALALSKAGAEVCVAGKVGADGSFLTDYLAKSGLDISDIEIGNGFTGHTIIEVDSEGQNQMILFGGANREITKEYCDMILKKHSDASLILMQYETSCVEYMLKEAHKAGIKTAINPSPYVDEIKNLPFEYADMIILNEFEGKSITGKSKTDDIILSLHNLNKGVIILTLGAEGSVYYDGNNKYEIPAFKANAVDTTGAGDTFTGYSLATLLEGKSPAEALKTGNAASAIEVTKPGAAETIPDKKEVFEFLQSII